MATFLFLQLVMTGLTPDSAAVAAPNSSTPPYSINTSPYQTLTAAVNSPFSTVLSVYVSDNNNAAVSGLTVTFTAPDGSTSGGATGSFGGSLIATTVTNAYGNAFAPTFTANSVGGQYRVIASIPNSSSTVSFRLSNNNPVSITFTPATSQTILIYPTEPPFSSGALQVSVTNPNGSPAIGVTVNLSAPGGCSVACLYVSGDYDTDYSGLIYLSTKTNRIQGSYQIKATLVGTALSTSTTLTNRVLSHLTIITGANQNAAINSTFATPLKVLVTDGANQPVAGIGVRFYAPVPGPVPPTPTPPNGSSTGFTPPVNINNQPPLTATPFVNSATLASNGGHSANSRLLVDYNATATGTFNGQYSARVTTSSDGTATAPAFIANNQTGSYRVEVDVYHRLDYQNINLYLTQYFSNMTNTLTAPPTPAAIVVASGNNQSTNINTAFATPLQVTVKDASGQPMLGQNVTFQAPNSGQSGTFASGSTSTTGQDNGNGTYSAVLTANSTPGSYTVTATVNGLSTPASFNLTNTPPIVITAVSGNYQGAAVNTIFNHPFQAKVIDLNGLPIAGVSVTFSASVSPNAGGTFQSNSATATALTDANGIAISPSLTANNSSGDYAILANVPGATSPATFYETNVLYLPTIPVYNKIYPISGDNQQTKVNTSFSTPLTVMVLDSQGNLPSNGAAVTFAVTKVTPTPPSTVAPGATFYDVNGSPVTTISVDATGVAFVYVVANGNPGGFLVTVTVSNAGNIVSTTSFRLTNEPRDYTQPTNTSVSYYVGSNWGDQLGGNDNRTLAYDRGFKATAGDNATIILDFSRQSSPANPYYPNNWIVQLTGKGSGSLALERPHSWVLKAAQDFIDGYSRGHINIAKIAIAINNDDATTPYGDWTCNNTMPNVVNNALWRETGRQWGVLVTSLKPASGVMIESGNDIEAWLSSSGGSWKACGLGTQIWFDGFEQAAPNFANVNYGSNAFVESGNSNYWLEDQLYDVVWKKYSAFDHPYPQIYCDGQANDWQTLYSHHPDIIFAGITSGNGGPGPSGGPCSYLAGNPIKVTKSTNTLPFDDAWQLLNMKLGPANRALRGSVTSIKQEK